MPFSDETKDRVNAAVNLDPNDNLHWIQKLYSSTIFDQTYYTASVNKVIMTQESEESRMKKVNDPSSSTAC
ncbi:uncharacterized protein L201_004361 [Kwoniella dendrophila CBS 6074]|uniref:Uncharacterized protein n=1 Tax=Kwoniella dendrophila CBS 6074 TaxID=1295534 RepID=A0AAX4JVP2_9TREE